jgi:cob(I)alamin adenosyltransferase
MPVYTKKGDSGFTGLFGTKKRVSKGSKIIRALGALDEANSYLGTIDSKKIDTDHIQEILMQISSIIAGAKVSLPDKETKKLEQEIDKLEVNLSPLTGFILPKGQLMYARAVVRRAEREVASLKNIREGVLKYLNRLSDYLFVLSRKINKS